MLLIISINMGEISPNIEISPEGAWQEPNEFKVSEKKAEEASLPSSADTLSEPKSPEPERENSLKEAIQETSDIGELCRIIEIVPFIQEGNKRVLGSDIAFLIKRADEELEKNFDEVIIHTITQEENHGRRQFGGRFNQIIQGGDLGIQDKVRALMKERMNERFQSRKREFMVNSVSSIRSLDTLYRVVRQFTVIDDKVIRWERNPKEAKTEAKKDHRDIRNIEELINLIKKAEEHIVEHLASQKGFADQAPREIYRQIGEVLDERWIPHDSGISRRAQQLIFEKVKGRYIDQASSESQSSEVSEPGLVSRGLSRLRGLFYRRKKK